MQCRVSLPVEGARERGMSDKAMWCLVFEDQAPGQSAAEKGEYEREGEGKEGGTGDRIESRSVFVCSHLD